MVNEENVYKSGAGAQEEAYKLVSEAREEMKKEALSIAQKLNDPAVLAALMYRTVNERENANRLMKSILEHIDSKFAQMDERIAKLEQKVAAGKGREKESDTHMAGEEILLPKQDEDIMNLVRARGHVCAEEVRSAFGYRGTNAASARLSKLYQIGLLEKKQVGRKVFYQINKTSLQK